MWKFWKSSAAGCLTFALLLGMLTGCGRYMFDSSAEEGGYEQVLQGAATTNRPEANEKKTFALMINAEITADDSGRANVLIGNPAENASDCTVTLRLDETGAVLYESPVLAPGERVAYAVLDCEALRAASGNLNPLPATAVFTILEPETNKPKGSIEAGVTITLQIRSLADKVDEK